MFHQVCPDWMEIRELLAGEDVLGRPVTRVRRADRCMVLLDLRDDPALMAYLADQAAEVTDSSSVVLIISDVDDVKR